MYPYKISWATESLKEIHYDDSYGYVNDLFEIKQIIYKYIDEYICTYADRIKNEIENCNNTRPIINRFYEMVNSQPYHDDIFLSIKYFDFLSKSWCNYEVNESELNDYVLSYFVESSGLL